MFKTKIKQSTLILQQTVHSLKIEWYLINTLILQQLHLKPHF